MEGDEVGFFKEPEGLCFRIFRILEFSVFQLIFEAKLNGKSFAKITNPRPLKFPNVKLYAQHYHPTASVIINTLKYKTKVEGEVEDARDSSGIYFQYLICTYVIE